jgi:hypothetical protein
MILFIGACQRDGGKAELLYAPWGVKAAPDAPDAILVSWNEVEGASGYYVYRSEAENGSYTRLGADPKKETEIRDSGVTAEKIYWYKVVALNKSKEQTMSEPAGGSTDRLWEYVYVCGEGSGGGASIIRLTEDGGSILAGDTHPSSEDSDILVVRLDAEGRILWQKSFGGIYWESVSSIEQTDDGGYVLAGDSKSFRTVRGDIWIVKLDANGGILWQKSYGGDGMDAAASIKQSGDGGYIVAGSTESFGAGGSDAWILKLDPSGEVVWQKTYGRDRNESACSIDRTEDGGYVAAGTIEVVAARFVLNDAWVLKLDADGNVVWQKAYGVDDNDGFSSIVQAMDGGYIAAGYTVHGTSSDILVLKLDPNGEIEWQKSYGGDSRASEIHQTMDGGYIVAGNIEEFGAGDYDAWILTLNAEGEVIWQKTYGGEDADRATSIQQEAEGGYVVAGSTVSFGCDQEDIWAAKLTCLGEYYGAALMSDTSVRAQSAGASQWDTDITPQSTDATVQSTTDTGMDGEAIQKAHDENCH